MLRFLRTLVSHLFDQEGRQHAHAPDGVALVEELTAEDNAVKTLQRRLAAEGEERSRTLHNQDGLRHEYAEVKREAHGAGHG